MHREAACQRTLATATFHGGNRDDRAHHSTPSRPSRGEVIRRIKTLSDSRRIVPRCDYLVVATLIVASENLAQSTQQHTHRPRFRWESSEQRPSTVRSHGMKIR